MIRNRELTSILSSNAHDVCAVSPTIVRVDIDCEDGAINCALLDIHAALQLSRDLAKAVAQAMRMDP